MKQTKIETRKQIILPVIEQTDMKKIKLAYRKGWLV